MWNGLIRYFDLQSSQRSKSPKGHASSTNHAPVIPQYVAVSLGVIVEPFLRHYIASGSWGVDVSTLLGRVIFGLIIGIVILPGIYKSTFDSTKPVSIQVAALFPLGIGWQSLFTSATKAVSG